MLASGFFCSLGMSVIECVLLFLISYQLNYQQNKKNT